MLNTIKNIINEKKVFQEAADIILEDEQLDDDIILGATEDQLVKNDDTTEDGEKKEDDIILSAEIDLRNNTSKDTLPTPPENANDAIEGETDTQKVDAGFADELLDAPVEDEHNHEEEPTDDVLDTPLNGEGEEEHPSDDEDLLDTPIDNEGEDKPAEECALTEAISIDTEDKDDVPDAPVEEKPEEKAEDDTQEEAKDDNNKEEPADEKNNTEEEPKEEENPVTSAVKDKVAEANEENTSVESKEELFKKLSSLTKGIEDVKASLLKY